MYGFHARFNGFYLKKRPRVSFGQLIFEYQSLLGIGQLEQSYLICYRGLTQGHASCHLVLREPVVFYQFFESVSLFKHIKVFSQQILNYRHFRRHSLVRLDNYTRDCEISKHSCRPQSAFARDELISVYIIKIRPPDRQRLYDAVSSDRIRKSYY